MPWRLCRHLAALGAPEQQCQHRQHAQIARPMRQLPVRAITSGANEAAMAAPPMIDVTYRPMHRATLSLKRDLISAGINAWISAMPIPASTALRISSAAESTNNRDTVARPMISKDNTTVRCSPRRWLMPRPKNIASPMAITGSMVSSEARLKLSGMSPRIADSNGPTAAIEGAD